MWRRNQLVIFTDDGACEPCMTDIDLHFTMRVFTSMFSFVAGYADGSHSYWILPPTQTVRELSSQMVEVHRLRTAPQQRHSLPPSCATVWDMRVYSTSESYWAVQRRFGRHGKLPGRQKRSNPERYGIVFVYCSRTHVCSGVKRCLT